MLGQSPIGGAAIGGWWALSYGVPATITFSTLSARIVPLNSNGRFVLIPKSGRYK